VRVGDFLTNNKSTTHFSGGYFGNNATEGSPYSHFTNHEIKVA